MGLGGCALVSGLGWLTEGKFTVVLLLRARVVDVFLLDGFSFLFVFVFVFLLPGHRTARRFSLRPEENGDLELGLQHEAGLAFAEVSREVSRVKQNQCCFWQRSSVRSRPG